MDAVNDPGEQPADPARHAEDPVHARRGSRDTASTTSTSRSSAPRSATPSTARAPATSRTRPSRPTRRRSRCAASAVHPGFAKGKMENAIKIASRIVERLPRDDLLARDHGGPRGFPASDRPRRRRSKARRSSLIVRDFTEEGLREKEALLEGIVAGRDAGFSRLDLRAEDRAAVPQHEGGAGSASAGDCARARGDPPRRPYAAAHQHPRRHRRIAAVVHGPALPQHFRRRACVPLAAGMGQPCRTWRRRSRPSSTWR